MEHSKIRELAPPQLATYFRGLLKDHADAEESLTASLFAAVERESLPPSVVPVWLSIARSLPGLVQALTQEFSVSIRQFAIKHFFKLLRRRRWLETWDGVGGTPGVLALLKDFSVLEVNMCLVRFSRWQTGIEKPEKQAKATELLQGLFPHSYPDARFQTSDERPFKGKYQLLLPGCSLEFVDRILRKGGPVLGDNVQHKANSDLLREHYKMLRQRCFNGLFDSAEYAININTYFIPLLQRAPELPSSKSKFSESMAFSLMVLERFVAQPEAKPPFIALEELIEPLIRRIQRRRVGFDGTKEVMDLSMDYLSSHPNEAKYLTFTPVSHHCFMYAYIRFWAASISHGLDRESHLVSLLRMYPAGQNHNISEYSSALRIVPYPQRLGLLKLLFAHIGDNPIDIDNIESLKKSAIKDWPCSVFFDLPRQQAIKLLMRLRKVNARDDFLAKGSGILSHPASQDLSSANSTILLNLLEEDKPEVLDRATSAIEEAKIKSTKSREQCDRAFHANLALFIAISSGSLELYGEALIWARRFVKDPLTVKTIFAKSSSNTIQGLRLLSGIPSNLDRITTSQIALNVHISNNIIFQAFETVVSAMKEPSFYKRDWLGFLDLVADVITERLNRSTLLQKTLDASDDQFYDLFWKDTLELVLRIEKTSLQPEYELLQLRCPSGSVHPTGSGVLSQTWQTPPSFRFIDNLARGRDMLWREFRRSLHPAVMIIPPLLPRGLPIQCLSSGFNIAVASAQGLTPYIFSRAEGLVFAGEEAFLPIPEDEDLRSAIGTFVDSFRLALQIYAHQGSDVTRQARTMKAWNYALENLSGRMTREEAIRTWKTKFLEAIPSFKPPSLQLPELDINRLWPLFPFATEFDEYTEWNPAATFEAPLTIISRQILPLASLDLTLAHYPPYLSPRVNAKFVTSYLKTQSFIPPTTHIWDPMRLKRKERNIPAVREGLIVSAILYLGLGHENVLTKPFPSPNDARYSAMWLDLSFVETKGIGSLTDHGALEIIKSFLSMVPPSILYKLTKISFNALFESFGESDANVARLEMRAYDLLCLLMKSDCPSLATKFILKAVIERPDSSSWHRKLLSIRFLRSLSAKHARDLIQSFAEGIQQKMKEAASFPKEESKSVVGGAKPIPRPYVKITTVKSLAQLLQGADFVPEGFTLDVLTSLFTASTHIDVRVAVVESLMEMLYGCRDESSDVLAGKILKSLESTILIASRLDERYPVSEVDWEDAKNTGKLPLIFAQGTTDYDRCIPPILETLIKRSSPRWQEKLLKQILVPILEASIATNTRWLEVFTLKHGLDFYSLKLPLLPVKPKFLKELVCNNIKYLPALIMDLYHSFILTAISPTPKLSALNAKLHDPAFSQLPEVKHWLSLYGHRPDICRYDEFDTTKLLRQKWTYPGSRITVSQLQTHVFEQAELLVSVGNIFAFEHFMRAFVPTSSIDSETIHSWGWLHNAQPVLKQIIALIESLRTLAWQRDQNRVPYVLPKVLKYKLYLLHYPPFEASGREISVFAEAVRGFVREICEPGKLYHEELPEIQVAAKRVGREYRARVACLLGALSDEMTVVDLLCVDLAKTMFMSAYLPQDSSDIEDSKMVVRSWITCSNELVRRKAVEVANSNNFKKVEGLLD